MPRTSATAIPQHPPRSRVGRGDESRCMILARGVRAPRTHPRTPPRPCSGCAPRSDRFLACSSRRNREGDAACDVPLSSEGGVSVASARATQSPSLQEFFERGVAIRSSRARSRPCRETSRAPASARESQNVPVSYPRRIDIAPLQATQHAHLQGFCASPLTDSNRRPPPYHGGFRASHAYTRVHSRRGFAWKSVHSERSGYVARRRACRF
jgi:hypothetical protein